MTTAVAALTAEREMLDRINAIVAEFEEELIALARAGRATQAEMQEAAERAAARVDAVIAELPTMLERAEATSGTRH